jgi:hypothetical protein
MQFSTLGRGEAAKDLGEIDMYIPLGGDLGSKVRSLQGVSGRPYLLERGWGHPWRAKAGMAEPVGRPSKATFAMWHDREQLFWTASPSRCRP